MRITNNMINKNSMININGNKIIVDKMNTQMTTQKKINRPSEDPVIAIRALRLRSNLNELSQYYEKNIPDAESWLDLTQTALSNMTKIIEDVYAQCVYGATDTLTAEDRDTILKNLQSLRAQIYKEGDADYAGRTIFTGYKTNSKLTFATEEPNTQYSITEKLSYKDIGEKNYYTNQVAVPTTPGEVSSGVIPGDMPQEVTNERIRLSYAGIDDPRNHVPADSLTLDVAYADGSTEAIDAVTKSYGEWESEGFAVGADEVIFIPETGEVILGEAVSEKLKAGKAEISTGYTKTGFNEGEVRPEHYFDCENITDPANPVSYTKENQEIAYTIAFNQSLVINTQASDVFDASMGRDVDEMMDVVSATIKAHEKVKTIENMMKQQQYADEGSQEMLSQWLEAAEKEASLMDDNMQKLYGSAITKFQGYLDDVKLAVTDVGSKENRLFMTKDRVSNQITAFKRLKSTNEDRELSDIIIDYTSAVTAYQASLMASSKASEQTLLNYL